MKFSIIIIFIHFSINLFCQSIILFEEDSITQIYENVDISSMGDNFALNLFFKNNTDDSILVNWRRELGEDCPLEWSIATADPNGTFQFSIEESPIPIQLSPTDSNFIASNVFLPMNTPGCCNVKLIFSLDENPDEPIDTSYYNIEINSEGCLSTSINEFEINEFEVYPNPVANAINLKNYVEIESLEIFDLSGRILYKVNLIESSKIDISSFPKGFYFCKIRGNSGAYVIKSIAKL